PEKTRRRVERTPHPCASPSSSLCARAPCGLEGLPSRYDRDGNEVSAATVGLPSRFLCLRVVAVSGSSGPYHYIGARCPRVCLQGDRPPGSCSSPHAVPAERHQFLGMF